MGQETLHQGVFSYQQVHHCMSLFMGTGVSTYSPLKQHVVCCLCSQVNLTYYSLEHSVLLALHLRCLTKY